MLPINRSAALQRGATPQLYFFIVSVELGAVLGAVLMAAVSVVGGGGGGAVVGVGVTLVVPAVESVVVVVSCLEQLTRKSPQSADRIKSFLI